MLYYSTLNKKGEIQCDYLGERIYNLLDRTFTLPKSGFDFRIFEVSKEYIARPDLVALDAYGDTMFADVICKINGISNPFELNEGIRLILPTPDYILDFAVKPSSLESESNNMTIKPTPKAKNEKRKANEAVVGDSRFKIDSATGIIIY